jgi:hypothetical protein
MYTSVFGEDILKSAIADEALIDVKIDRAREFYPMKETGSIYNSSRLQLLLLLLENSTG